jgi:hypothetical protein
VTKVARVAAQGMHVEADVRFVILQPAASFGPEVPRVIDAGRDCGRGGAAVS